MRYAHKDFNNRTGTFAYLTENKTMSKQTLTITVIGSRYAPADILRTTTTLAAQAMAAGHVLRSGAADGMDSTVTDAYNWNNTNMRAQAQPDIFIPWPRFGSEKQPEGLSYTVTGSDPRARKIAATLHPAWNAVRNDPKRPGMIVDVLSQGVRKLQTRNVHQILGRNLDSPSDLVIYWCRKDYHGGPTGGTATAVNLALSYGITCINLIEPDWKAQLIAFLDQQPDK